MGKQSAVVDTLGEGISSEPSTSDVLPGGMYAIRSTVIAAVDAWYRPLTPHNTMLLLIDHQVGPLWEPDLADARRRAHALARVAKLMRLPAVLTTIAPETWGPVIPEVAEILDEASPIVRSSVNAWDEPLVRSAIERTRRTKLIIAGGAGAVGVALCALSATRAEYDVYTPVDACARFGHAAVACLSRAGVIVTTTSLIAAELARGATGVSSESFKRS